MVIAVILYCSLSYPTSSNHVIDNNCKKSLNEYDATILNKNLYFWTPVWHEADVRMFELTADKAVWGDLSPFTSHVNLLSDT